jgi:hypothetical protein
MSCDMNGAPGQRAERDGGRAAAAARLVPKVSFGLSAAILAGVLIVALPPASSPGAPGSAGVTVTAGLNGPGAINGAGGNPPPVANQTACCA